MSSGLEKELKAWRKRLGEFDGSDVGVAQAYRRYVGAERREEMAIQLADDEIITHLINRVFNKSDELGLIGAFVSESVEDLVEHWLMDHHWWDTFEDWTIKEIKYEQYQRL